MMHTSKMIAVVALAVSAAACGEKDQALGASGNKHDGKPWQPGASEFVAKGWNPGDKTSWENQLRSRGQYQNEYNKTN